MSSFLDKVQIETSVPPMRDFDLSCQQLTTQFFMRPNIAYAKEFAQSKIRCNLKSYARMQPLLKPVLGSVQVHNRAFFVPFRTVWRPWNSFITNSRWTTSSGSQVLNAVPSVSNAILIKVLSSHASVVAQGDAYDFYYYASSSSTKYAFDYVGRHYYKILRQLGYAPQFNDGNSIVYSALPLLCYAKLFLDWYFPAQYSHVGIAAIIDGILLRDFRYDLSDSDLENILSFTAWCYYKNDYFTAAWDTPVSPSVDSYSSFTIPDISLSVVGSSGPDSDVNEVTNVDDLGAHTPVITNSANIEHGPISQYQIDSLKALNNYLKRHQLVGARPIDRYLADFGVKLNSEQLNRSIYIGSQSFPIQFQDVVSQSDTQDAVLGDYAGKGVAYDGQGNFEYDTDEFGYFIIVNSVEPDIAYCQGLDRNTLHKTTLDFLNNQFEMLGTQAVMQAEAVVGFSDSSVAADYSIFGFLPRYSEYKVGRDSITGLFNLNSVNGGLLAWSTARLLQPGQVHSLAFMRGDDAWQFARIFYGDVTSASAELDKFFFVHRVNIKVAMHARPMYDTYDFDEKDGKEIKVQANGVQL